MGTVRSSRGLEDLVERIGSDAVSAHSVPPSVARTACSITLRKFAGAARCDGRDAQRVHAYFWGVVRRRALGAGADLAALRERYVAATVAADMLEGGYPEHLVRDIVGSRYGSAAGLAAGDAA